MWKFKSCPRCGGDIYLDQDERRWYEHCLRCGNLFELKSIAEFKEHRMKGDKELVPTAVGSVGSIQNGAS